MNNSDSMNNEKVKQITLKNSKLSNLKWLILMVVVTVLFYNVSPTNYKTIVTHPKIENNKIKITYFDNIFVILDDSKKGSKVIFNNNTPIRIISTTDKPEIHTTIKGWFISFSGENSERIAKGKVTRVNLFFNEVDSIYFEKGKTK